MAINLMFEGHLLNGRKKILMNEEIVNIFRK